MTLARKGVPWGRGVVGALVAGSILAWIAYQVWQDWGAVAHYHPRWRVGPILASLAFQVPGWLLLVYNWRLMLDRLGGKAHFREHLKVYAYANLARAVPGTVWCVFGRVYLYEQRGVSKVITSTAAVLEWLLVGIAACGLYLLSLFFYPILSLPRKWFVLLLVLGALLFHPSIFNPVVNGILRRFRQEGWRPIQIRLGDTLLWLALDGMVVVLGGFALFFIINAIFPLPVAYVAAAIGAWSLSVTVGNLLFWLPGSLILKEGAMALALGSLFPTPIAVLITIVWRVWLTILDLFWAALATHL